MRRGGRKPKFFGGNLRTPPVWFDDKVYYASVLLSFEKFDVDVVRGI